MKAAVWHGKRDVRVDEVPDPTIQDPTDAIIRITSTGLCGSDLHLYEPLAPFMTEGDILGHEPMGIVEEVGPGVANLAKGDRVVMPFQIACGSCFMCDRGPADPVRDHPGPRAGQGCAALRLHQALRPGARRAGGVPPRPARRLQPDQGPRGPLGRPVRLPLRRTPHCLAGRGVRRDPGRRHRRGDRRRPDRRHGLADRPAPRAPGDRHRPDPGAARARPRVRRRDHRPDRARQGPRRRGPQHDRGSRRRLRHRRRRHGGARVPGRQGRPADGRACCPTRWPRR